MPVTDEQLLARFTEGDATAFEELVRRHERRIYNLCLRMLGRPEEARDATQDTFLSVLRRAGSFRGQAALTTWLHRIAVNSCYDLLRKAGRTPVPVESVTDDSVGVAAGPAADPSDSVAASVDVQRALLAVPLDFRIVLILHDVQDLPYEDVAAALDVPLGTVKSRLHRGRIALAHALEGTGGGRPASEGKMEEP